MQKLLFPLLALFLLTALPACKDDTKPDPTPTGFGDVVIEFENRAGDETLVFGKDYVNAAGETVNFSTFNYFVSNFVLVSTDGTEYVVPKDDCYFLCNGDDADSREITLTNIPAGDYSHIHFMIGVDSAKSVSPVSERTGDLDPAGAASGMYWSWNAGYIFVKVEGTSPQAPVEPSTGQRIFQYHTGLFGGFNSPTLNNLKEVHLDAPHEAAEVRENSEAPHVHMYVDVLEMFTNPTNISVAANPTSHAGPYSKTVADNYADMFSIDHVHNHRS